MKSNGSARIGLTMGDPAGVGPELVLRALADPIVHEQCGLTVFGDYEVLKRCSEQLRLPFPDAKRTDLVEYLKREPDEYSPDVVIVDIPELPLDSFYPKRVSAACGRASFAYIQAAIDAAQRDQLDAITTLPINKESLHLAGIRFPGHTEMFAERDKSDRWCMMQYSQEITCTFVTVHVGYAEVPALLTKQRVLDTIELTHEALLRIQRSAASIVVCGLNPHAGEHGIFGRGEEEQAIIPAIEAARAQGISIEGPLPPDAAFLPSKRKQTGAYVCMYHDQGHIPVKALAFDSAVNTTLGLKMIRTSVDHGTAFDIAWEGTARPNSLFAAIQLSRHLCQN